MPLGILPVLHGRQRAPLPDTLTILQSRAARAQNEAAAARSRIGGTAMPEGYQEVYDRWQSDPEAFWMQAAQAVDWTVAPTQGFDPRAGAYGRWFPDAVCNTCHNAVDRHVAGGRGDQPAILYDSPLAGAKRTVTYRELLAEVEATAAALAALGVARGDRVVIYMPMVPEAVFAMLACARLGAVHSVVFGGFAAPELAARIDDAQAAVVLSASCGLEPGRVVHYKPLLDAALDLCRTSPRACLILQRPQSPAALRAGRDHDWADAIERARGTRVPCTPVQATDPLYIIYTSGTTGRPKGVVRDNGGHMVALLWALPAVYGVGPGDVFWAASDIGWVVGHSLIAYGPLLIGATALIYEGKPVGTPDAGAYWRVVREHGVKALFTAPTAMRAIRKDDPDATHIHAAAMPSLTHLFLAGERADPETVRWAEATLSVPVIDHWWQTETGWPVVSNPVGLGAPLPVKYGSSAVPLPGWALDVLDDAGHPVPRGTMGNLVLRLPLPPGPLPTLWHADERFRDTYLRLYPGHYATSDAGYVDADGYVFIMGRTDDVVNVAGHRLSTGAMEEAMAAHPLVAECAVIGVHDDIKGEVPLGLAVLKTAAAGHQHDAVAREIVQMVRDRVGPVAALRRVVVVERLPKTRSGKILRATMKKIAEGAPWAMPATIEDPAVLDEIGRALQPGDAA